MERSAEARLCAWTYDPMNRVIEETNELADSRQFVYDGGLLTRRIDRRGWVRQFTFDRFDRNTAKLWYDNTSDAVADQNRRNTEVEKVTATKTDERGGR